MLVSTSEPNDRPNSLHELTVPGGPSPETTAVKPRTMIPSVDSIVALYGKAGTLPQSSSSKTPPSGVITRWIFPLGKDRRYRVLR